MKYAKTPPNSNMKKNPKQHVGKRNKDSVSVFLKQHPKSKHKCLMLQSSSEGKCWRRAKVLLYQPVFH